MNFKTSLEFPDEISPAFKHLIKGLLTDASQRFRYEQLIKHQVFTEIDWNNLRETPPPYIPIVTSREDTSNFDDFDPETRPTFNNMQTNKEFSGKNLPFVGFTYSAPLESLHESFRSCESPKISDSATKRKVKDLQDKVAELTVNLESSRNKYLKVKEQHKRNEDKYEREILRLENVIMDCEKSEKELKRLVRLERADRLLTEKKTCQILEFMKGKRKNFGELNNEQNVSRSKENQPPQGISPTVQQLEDAMLSIQEADERQNLINFIGKSKSLSPYFPKMVLERNSSKISCYSEADKGNVKLNEDWGKMMENYKRILEDHQKMKNDKDAALSQIEGLKNTILILEKDLQRAELERYRETQSSKSSDTVSDLMDEINGKQDIIVLLQKQLLDAKSQLKNVGEDLEIKTKQLESVTLEKQNLKFDLKIKEEQKFDLEKQNELLQRTVATLSDKSKSPQKTDSLASEEFGVQTDLSTDNEKFELLYRSTVLEDENQELQGSIKQLNAEIDKLRSLLESPDSKNPSYEKLLKEKTDALSEAELDIKILKREKTQAEELMSTYRESNRDYRNKLKAIEMTLSEKTKLEEDMKMKIKTLEDSAVVTKKEFSDKMSQYESHDDINQLCMKSQDRFDELIKQNEKLKDEKTYLNNEKEKLLSELRTLQQQLTTKTQDCSKQEKTITVLKKICSELEEQLKQFEDLEESDEKDLIAMTNQNAKLVGEKRKLEHESEKLSVQLSEEKEKVQQLQLQVNQLEEELQSQQSLFEDQVDHQKEIISSLEDQMRDYQDSAATDNHNFNAQSRKIEKLENLLVQIKEESAKHITEISSLKVTNLKLSQTLDDVSTSEHEAQVAIQMLQNNIEKSEALYNEDRQKLQETSAQQNKLINFLQTKVENLEKKKRQGLVVPRIFGKKESSYETLSPAEELNQERIKCRRLEDQLSKVRAENIQLRKELCDKIPRTPLLERTTISIPKSPMTHAVHAALTSSPTPSSEVAYPIFLDKPKGKFVKPQGMKHCIPHMFNEMTCMRAYKCSACLDSIHFGRPATKCQECDIICHPKCAPSLPNTCGIPSGLVQHFKSAAKEASSSKINPNTESRMEGWIKIAKINSSGWLNRYIQIEDSVLHLYEDANSKNAVESIDFADKDGETVVISAVSATELPNSAKSDLPYVLKIVYRPFTTCWPSRSFYFMVNDFSDKQVWVDSLESMSIKYRTAEKNISNKLSGESVFKLKGDKVLDVNCIYMLDDDLMLLGAMEGLFAIPYPNNTTSLMSRIDGFDSVYQISRVDELGRIVFIAGQNKSVMTVQLDVLHTSIIHQLTLTPDVIGSSDGTHLLAVQEKNQGKPTHLCAAAANLVIVYLWDSSINNFYKRKIVTAREPCSCIHFTTSSIIFGCNKFYELDLKTYGAEEFLDSSDSRLSGIMYAISLSMSFPVSIFLVSSAKQEEEYLLCFHEFGVFVDGFGQKSREDDMKWSRLPLAFAFRAPYLFVTHFFSLEVIEIVDREVSQGGHRAVMEISKPLYLGWAPDNHSVFITSSRNDSMELLCVNGRSLKACVESSDSQSVGTASTAQSSNGEEYSSEFSFTTSLIECIENGTSECPSDTSFA